jgi:hypothetical protein
MNTVHLRRSVVVCLAVLAIGLFATRTLAQDGPLVASPDVKIAPLAGGGDGPLTPAADRGLSCGITSCGTMTYHGGTVQHS